MLVDEVSLLFVMSVESMCAPFFRSQIAPGCSDHAPLTLTATSPATPSAGLDSLLSPSSESTLLRHRVQHLQLRAVSSNKLSNTLQRPCVAPQQNAIGPTPGEAIDDRWVWQIHVLVLKLSLSCFHACIFDSTFTTTCGHWGRYHRAANKPTGGNNWGITTRPRHYKCSSVCGQDSEGAIQERQDARSGHRSQEILHDQDHRWGNQKPKNQGFINSMRGIQWLRRFLPLWAWKPDILPVGPWPQQTQVVHRRLGNDRR